MGAIIDLLPLLSGWRWIWDINESTRTLEPGQIVDLIPRVSGKNGWGTYIVVAFSHRHGRIYLETEKLKASGTPYMGDVYNLDTPSNTFWKGAYDRTYNIYSLMWSPSQWMPFKDYWYIYVKAPDVDPVTRAPISDTMSVFFSAVIGVVIDDAELFKESLRVTLGTKGEEAMVRRVVL